MKKLLIKRKSRHVFCSAVFVLLICSWPVCEAATQAAPAQPAPQPVVQNVASLTAANFHYNPKGKLDPFKPLIREVKKDPKAKPRFGLTPLERLSLEQVKLVGIGSYENSRIAVITDPKGKSYILARGSMLGPNRGRVADILADQIIVEEPITGERGKMKYKRIPLLLHKEESEGK